MSSSRCRIAFAILALMSGMVACGSDDSIAKNGGAEGKGVDPTPSNIVPPGQQTTDDDSAEVDDAGDASLPGADADPDASDADTDADAAADGGQPVGPAFCGNDRVDPGEECDPGLLYAPPGCSYLCQSRDFLPIAMAAGADPRTVERTLGHGAHPVAVGSDGAFAMATTERANGVLSVVLRSFNRGGLRLSANPLAEGGHAVDAANPVVASTAPGTYAAAWADINGGTGDETDIALRLVGPNGIIASSFANASIAGAQRDPSIVFTGSKIVVAWTDASDPASGPDIKVREFDASLQALTAEKSIAPANDVEGAVSLAAFDSGYAAAWRTSSADAEALHVWAANHEWVIPVSVAGPVDDRPAMVDLDGTHLLVAYSEGAYLDDGTYVSKIRAAVVDTAVAATPTAIDIALADGASSHDEPRLVRAGASFYFGWRASAVASDANGEELYFKSITLQSGAVDWTAAAQGWPYTGTHRIGDQRNGIMVANGGMIVTAWDDLGSGFGATEAQGDVVAVATAAPVVRSGDIGSETDANRVVARSKDLWCQHLANCCGDPATFDMTTCMSRKFDPTDADNAGTPAALIPRGHVVFHKGAADRCLDGSATRCGSITPETDADWYNACSDAFEGTLGAGEAGCVSEYECAKGNYCDKASSTCRPLKQVGESCTATGQCFYRGLILRGAYCTSNDDVTLGVCATTHAVDAACTTAYECVSGICDAWDPAPAHCLGDFVMEKIANAVWCPRVSGP